MWEDDDEDLELEQTQPVRRARRSGEPRSNLYLLTGLVIGLAIGLVYAWVISPVKYTDESPATLSDGTKDQYRSMIALAYAADQDIMRASERLKLVDTGNPQFALAAQAQRLLAEKQSAQEARALTILAANLGQAPAVPDARTPQGTIPADGAATLAATPIATLNDVSAIQTPTLPAPTPTATSTPAPSFTPRSTATPLHVLDAPFTLKSKREVCDGSIPTGQLQIQVNDSGGKPVPGIKITITWQDGEDTFYTGLVPEVNPGFADYAMSAGIVYRIRAGEVSQPIDGFTYNPGCALSLVLAQGR